MEAANIGQLQQSAERNAREQVTAFIRIARVKEISGLSKSTIWRWINGDPKKGVPSGRFPAPAIQEGNTVLWDLAEIYQWRAQCFEKRKAREATK